jgi:hypothetical protein
MMQKNHLFAATELHCVILYGRIIAYYAHRPLLPSRLMLPHFIKNRKMSSY